MSVNRLRLPVSLAVALNFGLVVWHLGVLGALQPAPASGPLAFLGGAGGADRPAEP